MQPSTASSNRKGTPRHGGKSCKRRPELGLQQAALSREQQFSFGLQNEELFLIHINDRCQ